MFGDTRPMDYIPARGRYRIGTAPRVPRSRRPVRRLLPWLVALAVAFVVSLQW